MSNRELDSGVYATHLNGEILKLGRPLDPAEQQRWDVLVAGLREIPIELPADGHLVDQFLPGAIVGPDYRYNPVAEAEAIARQAIIDSNFGPLTQENDPNNANTAYLHALTAADYAQPADGIRKLIGVEPANV